MIDPAEKIDHIFEFHFNAAGSGGAEIYGAMANTDATMDVLLKEAFVAAGMPWKNFRGLLTGREFVTRKVSGNKYTTTSTKANYFRNIQQPWLGTGTDSAGNKFSWPGRKLLNSYIETCYIDSKSDMATYMQCKDRLVEELVKAVCKYYNTPYIAPGGGGTDDELRKEIEALKAENSTLQARVLTLEKAKDAMRSHGQSVVDIADTTK